MGLLLLGVVLVLYGISFIELSFLNATIFGILFIITGAVLLVEKRGVIKL